MYKKIKVGDIIVFNENHPKGKCLVKHCYFGSVYFYEYMGRRLTVSEVGSLQEYNMVFRCSETRSTLFSACMIRGSEVTNESMGESVFTIIVKHK